MSFKLYYRENIFIFRTVYRIRNIFNKLIHEIFLLVTLELVIGNTKQNTISYICIVSPHTSACEKMKKKTLNFSDNRVHLEEKV